MLRKPDSIPAGDTLIEDPVMEPFFICKSSSGGYTLYERVIKGENKTPYIKEWRDIQEKLSILTGIE